MGGNRKFKQTSTNTGYSYYEGNEEGTKRYMVRTPGTQKGRSVGVSSWRTQRAKDNARSRMGRGKRTSRTKNERYTF